MKGLVFTEFLDMIGQVYGPNTVDDVLDEANLPSGGAYSSAGTYEHTEFIEIGRVLSAKTNKPFKNLVHDYGVYLFSRFHALMPQFFEEPKDVFTFLETVDQTIHVEVKKLYPDAALPEFRTLRDSPQSLIMTYKSRCPFGDFAAGLIAGCIAHYKENIQISHYDPPSETHFIRIFRLERHV